MKAITIILSSVLISTGLLKPCSVRHGIQTVLKEQ